MKHLFSIASQPPNSSEGTRKRWADPEYKERVSGAISRGHLGKKLSEEHRRRLSESHMGKKSHLGIPQSEETKKKISNSKKGKKRKYPITEETRKKMSNSAKIRANKPEWKKNISEKKKGQKHTEETKHKLQQYKGEMASGWIDGRSYDPYCEKFDDAKKEEIRNSYNRKCFNCGKEEKINLTTNGHMWKLSVHHVDGDKQQGCNGKRWFLIPLCLKCHARTTNNNIYWQEHITDLVRIYNIKDIWTWFYSQ